VQLLSFRRWLIAACLLTGLFLKDFFFEKGRQTLLKKLAEEERTMILYESPVRLTKRR
jgi:16S rRNA (cytidine1402-2'-O)-methyltransferase